MQSNRKKISITLFTTFILSRASDAYATWHYSPDLTEEGNFIVTHLNGGWLELFFTQIIALLFVGFICYRLYRYHYRKKEFDEKMLSLVFKQFSRTPEQRFKNEFAWAFSATFAGFMLALIWVLAHNIQNTTLIDEFARLRIGIVPFSMVMILSVGYLFGKFVINQLIKRSYVAIN